MHDLKSTEERQKEIIEAAKVLFFEKGYEQTSTVDIMRAVGIAKGTLYYHFASKKRLCNHKIVQFQFFCSNKPNLITILSLTHSHITDIFHICLFQNRLHPCQSTHDRGKRTVPTIVVVPLLFHPHPLLLYA